MSSDTQFDPIAHPKHYNQGPIECWDAIEAALGQEGFKAHLTGCCLKYLWRYPCKDSQLQDLLKCRAYLDKLIEKVAAGRA